MANKNELDITLGISLVVAVQLKVKKEKSCSYLHMHFVHLFSTIMVFNEGKMVDMLSGAVPKAPFNDWLNESL